MVSERWVDHREFVLLICWFCLDGFHCFSSDCSWFLRLEQRKGKETEREGHSTRNRILPRGTKISRFPAVGLFRVALGFQLRFALARCLPRHRFHRILCRASLAASARCLPRHRFRQILCRAITTTRSPAHAALPGTALPFFSAAPAQFCRFSLPRRTAVFGDGFAY